MTYKMDRLHRNMRKAICSLDEIAMKDVSLIVTSQNIDTSTAMGRAMIKLGEYDRDAPRGRGSSATGLRRRSRITI